VIEMLKVYAWQGWRSECSKAANGSMQTRELCAAKSKAAVARITGCKYAYQLFNLGETGNELEVKVALSEPGVVFWKPLDSLGGFTK